MHFHDYRVCTIACRLDLLYPCPEGGATDAEPDARRLTVGDGKGEVWMGVDPQIALAAAERLFTVVEAGDLEALREIFTPDARIWHNTDNRSISVEQSIRSIRAIQKDAQDYRYTAIRRLPTPEGFVQQHVLVMRLANGTEITDPACCVCRVVDGRVAHMDAYHDSAVFKVPGFAVPA